MDLRERLDDYEVTAVPPREVALTLVWSEAPDTPEVDDVVEAEPHPGLTILDDYRITRIPGRAAS